jgi:hypothetical protein
MLSSPGHLALLLFELGSRCLTNRAELRSSLTLINITAYSTNPFLHNSDLLFLFDV